MMICRRLLTASFATIQNSICLESQMIIDPHFFERKDIISRIQNHFSNKTALNDIERSFRDFKRGDVKTKYLERYNQFVQDFRKEKLHHLEDHISPTLFKEFKKLMKAKEELPYYFEEASSCELVQARGYSETIANVKSTNKWYQLVLRYRLTDGDDAYHILERHDKYKSFKFIKFYL